MALYGLHQRLFGLRRRPEVGDVRRILVIRLDLMGDVVFSLPAIAAAAELFPGARIDALVMPYAADLLADVPSLTMIHQIDLVRLRRPAGWLQVGSLAQSILALRRERYDLAIGLSGQMAGLFAALSGARWRTGYAAETYPGCYNLSQAGRRYERPQHEVQYCLDLVKALAPGKSLPTVSAPTLPTSTAPQEPQIETQPYAVLVPGASNGSAKRWPPTYWARLGDLIANECGLEIVLSGAGSERALVEHVARSMRAPSWNTAGETSVAELVQLLTRARIVVAGDTGPLHVAAALGRPVIGIFGPTDPVNTGPIATRSEVLRLGLPCSPCYDLHSPADCKLPDRSIACMWGIEPGAAFEAVRRVLAGSR
jgi:lipopolysaccharide heptosyltransferase II